MRLALFSHGISRKAARKLIGWAGKKPKDTKVVYITTAANTYPPNPDWLMETMNELKNIGFQVERFDLEDSYKKGIDLKKHFVGTDIIFISGGNTFYLVYWMRKSGFEKTLIQLLKKGVIYAGESAGAVCLFDNIETMGLIDKPTLAPKPIKRGLNLTNFITIPHWGSEKYQTRLEKIKRHYESKECKIYALADNEALFVEKGKVDFLKQ